MIVEQVHQAMAEGKSRDEAIEAALSPMREALKMMLRSKPFRPFRMRLTSKSTQDVHDPRQIEIGKSVARVTIPSDLPPAQWKWHSTISLLHLVSLETLAEKPLDADAPTVVVDQRNKG
jgi:hypothetical protein